MGIPGVPFLSGFPIGERIPYILVGGMSFFDRREVRDALAYAKVAANPDDEVSLLRILNVPPRGIGKGSVQTLLGEAVRTGQALWKVLGEAAANPKVPAAAATGIEQLRGAVRELKAAKNNGLAAGLRKLLDRVDYRSELTRH